MTDYILAPAKSPYDVQGCLSLNIVDTQVKNT